MYLCPIERFVYGAHPYDKSWLLPSRYDKFNYPSIPVSSEAIPNFICPGYGYFSQRYSPPAIRITMSEIALSNELRMLWEQHGAWTRMTIMSLVFGLPDVELATNRLLQNPVDFGKALSVFYGDKIASKFSDLLKEHLVIAAQLVKAANAGDNKTAADAEKKWYANGDEIAVFLSSINPYWSQEDWKMMLHKHLMLVKSEAVSMLTKDYAAGISVYDEIEKQALEMADVMTEGIITQFPDRFL